MRLSLALVLATIALTPARADDAQLAVLVDGNVLVRFTAANPASAERVAVQGLRGTLVGIDCRPADGRLYGLTTTYDLYAIDPASGSATSVSTLTLPFDGGPRAGLDFNPQADRLRLVAASGQNLRVNVTIGAAAADAALAYAPGDRHHGRRPAVSAAAYSNDRAGAETTQLFDLDTDLDVLALQDPPNDGRLVTIGPLGADVGPRAGFDIVTDAGGRNRAFAASGTTLWAVALETGAATMLGTIGGGAEVAGLAVIESCGRR